MPKYGYDVTNIGEANLSAAKDIRPGIAADPGRAAAISAKGNAIAGAVTALGGQAVEAYKGYQYATLETAQEENISNYLQTREAGIDIAGTAQTREQLLDSFDLGPESEQFKALNAVERRHQEALTRYKKGVEQGVSTPEEFSIQVLKTTREAVARNPGLRQELLATTQRVLDDSGIQKTLKFDAVQAENQQKLVQAQETKLQAQAIDYGIPLSDPQYRTKVLFKNQQKDAYDMAQRAYKLKKDALEAIAEDPEQFSHITDGARVSLVSGLNQILNNPDLQTPAQKLQALTSYSAQAISNYQGSFGANAGLPQVTTAVDQFKDLVKIYKESVGGKLDADELSNKVRAAEATAKLKLNKFDEEAVLNIVSKLPPHVSLVHGPTVQAIRGIADSVTGQGSKPLPEKDKIVIKESVKEAFKQASEDPAKLPLVSGMLQSFTKDIHNNKIEEKEKIYWADTYVKELATGGRNELLKKLPSEERQQSIVDVRKYLNSFAYFVSNAETFPDGKVIPRKDTTPVISKIPGEKTTTIGYGESKVTPSSLYISALDDGTITFKTRLPFELENQQLANDYNKHFGSRINTSLKALANLNGHGDVKQIINKQDFITVLGSILGVNDSKQEEEIRNHFSSKIPTKGGNPVLDLEGLQAKETFPTQGAAESNARSLAKAIRSKKEGTKERAILEDEWENLTGEKWK